MSKLSRKQAKKLRQDGLIDMNQSLNPNKFRVKPLEMKSRRQSEAVSLWNSGLNLNLHGTAGTGKTFLALFLALQEALNKGTAHQVIIVRSVVPSRDMGFLKGGQGEKTGVYETPYFGICEQLIGRHDAYSMLKSTGKIQFVPTSFIRGTTWDNAIIVVDEPQNMSAMELHTVFTRVGMNSRLIFSGDTKQDDLTSERYNEKSGFPAFKRILEEMDEFGSVEFCHEDILRSDIIKSYIIVREKLGM